MLLSGLFVLKAWTLNTERSFGFTALLVWPFLLLALQLHNLSVYSYFPLPPQLWQFFRFIVLLSGIWCNSNAVIAESLCRTAVRWIVLPESLWNSLCFFCGFLVCPSFIWEFICLELGMQSFAYLQSPRATIHNKRAALFLVQSLLVHYVQLFGNTVPASVLLSESFILADTSWCFCSGFA